MPCRRFGVRSTRNSQLAQRAYPNGDARRIALPSRISTHRIEHDFRRAGVEFLGSVRRQRGRDAGVVVLDHRGFLRSTFTRIRGRRTADAANERIRRRRPAAVPRTTHSRVRSAVGVTGLRKWDCAIAPTDVRDRARLRDVLRSDLPIRVGYPRVALEAFTCPSDTPHST